MIFKAKICFFPTAAAGVYYCFGVSSQLYFFNPPKARIWHIALGSSQECFLKNRSEIERLNAISTFRKYMYLVCLYNVHIHTYFFPTSEAAVSGFMTLDCARL